MRASETVETAVVPHLSKTQSLETGTSVVSSPMVHAVTGVHRTSIQGLEESHMNGFKITSNTPTQVLRLQSQLTKKDAKKFGGTLQTTVKTGKSCFRRTIIAQKMKKCPLKSLQKCITTIIAAVRVRDPCSTGLTKTRMAGFRRLSSRELGSGSPDGTARTMIHTQDRLNQKMI